jgi:FAD/FMN-containing dehydrogenase
MSVDLLVAYVSPTYRARAEYHNALRSTKTIKKEDKVIEEAKLARIVGKTNIDRKQTTLKEYSRDMSFVYPMRPELVVKPRNTAEIQQIVNLAKQTQTPLVPVSSGGPHFRGDTVPSTGGAIIVDLSGMKKIIHISRKHRVAMFEPGVTFEELIKAVAKEGLRLNVPLLPRLSKSVVGSMLEREPVIMPKYQWDIADPLACTEVILGTGDMIRTGAAAGSGTIEEQWAAGGAQKEAAGPSSASWYRLIQGSQGTMGIVTWVSARCEIIPKLEEPFLAGSTKLDKIMDAVHWLIRRRLVNECLVVNNTNLASIMARNGAGDIQQTKASLPPWVLFFNIAAYDYFPEERLAGQTKDMLEIMQRVGLGVVKTLVSITAVELLKTVQKPSAEPFWKLRYKGACQDIFFITIYDKLDELIKVMYDAADASGYPASDIGIYLQPIVQGVNCHCEFNLPYNPESPEELNRVKELSAMATKSLIAKGAFFSRPYGEHARFIMNRDAATVAALKKVKAIVDPDNIMNPGKLCF